MKPVCSPKPEPKASRQGLGDDRRVVPEDVGVVALPEIEDPVAVLVRDVRPRRRDDARRERTEEPDGVAAAVHEVPQRLGVQRRRARRVPFVFLCKPCEQFRVVSLFHAAFTRTARRSRASPRAMRSTAPRMSAPPATFTGVIGSPRTMAASATVTAGSRVESVDALAGPIL